MNYSISLTTIMPSIRGRAEESEVEFAVRGDTTLHYETFLYPHACEILSFSGMGHLIPQLSEKNERIVLQAARIHELRAHIRNPIEGINVEEAKQELSSVTSASPFPAFQHSARLLGGQPLYALLCHKRAHEAGHPYESLSWELFLQEAAASLARGVVPFSSNDFRLALSDLGDLYEECTKGSLQDMARAFLQAKEEIEQKRMELKREHDELEAFLHAARRPTQQESLAALEVSTRSLLSSSISSPLRTTLQEINESLQVHPSSSHSILLREGLLFRYNTYSHTLAQYNHLLSCYQVSPEELQVDPVLSFRKKLQQNGDEIFRNFCHTLYRDLFIKFGKAQPPMARTLALLQEGISQTVGPCNVRLALLSPQDLRERGVELPLLCQCGRCDQFFELRIGEGAPRYIQYSKGLNPFQILK